MSKNSKVLTNRQLRRENLKLQKEIAELHKLINEMQKENMITSDFDKYEEWLNSDDADLLAQAYESEFCDLEVAPTMTNDAKERLAESKLWI